MMNDQQLLRYSRQLMLPQLEVEGQERLLASRVLVLGLGGLGSAAALYLAAAGVGELVLVDFDEVDLSNLQRQIIHDQSSIGQAKVESAASRIKAINSDIKVRCCNERLSEENLVAQLKGVDLVLDCSDNFTTRFALNRAAVAAGVPLVSGAAIGFSGQLTVIDPRQPEKPCYRCLYQEDDELALSCAEAGVISPLVGMVGSAQALEAVKVLAAVGESLAGRLLVLDALSHQWQSLRLPKNPECPVCSLWAK